jgi:hypothetical protein
MSNLSYPLTLCFVAIFLLQCSGDQSKVLHTNGRATSLLLSRAAYKDQLQGFWLGACIANWTGLVTEMDKIGNIGDIQTGDFYTRNDWGQPDQPSIWGEGVPSDLSPTIDFVTRAPGEQWGADDDTDIEYMYQHLLYTHATTVLTAEQIRDGWLKHIKAEEENYLWVSNQHAFDLMQKGMLPPQTGQARHNPHCEMIDAQLTTEIFGLLAPGRSDVALKLSHLPIRATADANAIWIAEFYVIMHALAGSVDQTATKAQQVQWLAHHARQHLPDTSYAAKMYDFVKTQHQAGRPWEETRDSIYVRYQVEQQDGYDVTAKNLYCNGCFAAGINFAASLVSLFYGQGDFKETIKIAVLTGWDADNPAATWGGLLGFLLGKKGIESTMGQSFSNQFNIHRTRQNFPNNGIDTFEAMAEKGLSIIDRVVTIEMGGIVDTRNNTWEIPFATQQ